MRGHGIKSRGGRSHPSHSTARRRVFALLVRRQTWWWLRFCFSSWSPEEMSSHYEMVVKSEAVEEPTYVVYTHRWSMLAIFASVSMTNASHWISMAIVGNLLTEYYGVSNAAVEWTSMIYMATYVPLVLPAAMILDMWVRPPPGKNNTMA
ncbi:hypothetical protein PR048_020097 [Dryococelus australis]|uniref:Uncharacterized protein n=1 Tax=Dryococelus australis TaxID=614101 RepID=A0ABQ9H5D4_9NEOP|nr:hypothetical protein PR048_020097 [Dryococelus australis]